MIPYFKTINVTIVGANTSITDRVQFPGKFKLTGLGVYDTGNVGTTVTVLLRDALTQRTIIPAFDIRQFFRRSMRQFITLADVGCKGFEVSEQGLYITKLHYSTRAYDIVLFGGLL